MLKAYYVFKKDETPPLVHNLKHLANKTDMYYLMSDAHKDIIDLLIPLNIEARYPTYKNALLGSLTHKKCNEFIKLTKLLKEWIESKL